MAFDDGTNIFQYDGAGNRMSANRSGVVARYVLDRNSPLSQVLAETDSSGNIIYYYIYGLGLISRIDNNNNAEFYHYDSRGSTIALTDASGQIMEVYAYDPFGRPVNGIPSDNRFRYLGRHGVMDEENGFLYIRARYYSTKRGRFITKDPTTGKNGDSQSMNRYIYALNNPVRLIDISGLSAQETSGQTLSLATSDNIFSHNYLISPMTGGLSPQTAGSTPQFLPGGSGLGDRIASLGDVVETVGSSQPAMNFLQFSESQQNLLGTVGDVSGVIGFAINAVQVNGGINNTIAGFANAGSNIQWLNQGATFNQQIDIAHTSINNATAAGINTLLGPVFSAINVIFGSAITVTGTGYGNAVQTVQQGYLNGLYSTGNILGPALYNTAPSLFQ
jgi:RHS repeat-associated protein